MFNTVSRASKIAIVAASCFVFTALPAAASDSTPVRSISLIGVGLINARPDIAQVTSGVISKGKTAAVALAQNTKLMTKVIAGLKAEGIEPRDIQTTGFSVNPEYYYDQKNRRKQPKIIGYNVQNQVHITVRQLDKLGGILDKVVTLGANQIHGVSFTIDNPQDLQDKARKRAIEDAMRKAQIYTKASGAKLGRVLTIREGAVRRPQPQYARKMAMSVRAESADVPVEAGEQAVSIQVSVTWALD